MSVQLTPINSFKPSNIIFDACTKRNIPDSEVVYHQTNIQYRYPDGSKGPLIFQLPRCPTFGVSNKYGDGADKLSLSIVLGDRDGISTEHRAATDAINEVVKACKAYSLSDEVKNKLGAYDLEERDLKDITPLKFQKDKETKKPLLDRPNVMNIKFRVKNNKETKVKEIVSKVYAEGEFDEKNQPVEVDPRDFVGKSGSVVPLIQIESIYYGTKYKLQIKVFECDIKSNESGFKSLIKRSAAPAAPSSMMSVDMDVDADADSDNETNVVMPAASAPAAILASDNEEEESSDENDTEEVSRPATPPPAAKPTASTTKAAPARRVGAGKK